MKLVHPVQSTDLENIGLNGHELIVQNVGVPHRAETTFSSINGLEHQQAGLEKPVQGISDTSLQSMGMVRGMAQSGSLLLSLPTH